MKDISYFLTEMECNGYSIFSDIVPRNLTERMKIDIGYHINFSKKLQEKNKINVGIQGGAHHILWRSDGFTDFLDFSLLDNYIESYFSSKYIINSFGGIDNNFLGVEYKHGIEYHRDIRSFSMDYKLMLNMLVMLDDFTEENGATKIIPGSHRLKEKPSDQYMQENYIQKIGKEGSILLFNSNIWHSAGKNVTGKPRRAATLSFTKPFFKQQMDYPRLLGSDFPKNERLKQILGYNSRVPSSHDEWYQPPENRLYKSDQE